MSNNASIIKNNKDLHRIGDVIRILDEYTLLVNVGYDKLKRGDKIAVYSVVEPIFNLDGTILSNYEYTKGILEVIDVNPKYSVCQNTETRTVDPGVLGTLSLSPLFKTKEERVPLNVNKEDISPLKQVNPQIQVGDPIKRIYG